MKKLVFNFRSTIEHSAKIAIFLAPIMPNISENILNKIGLSIKKLSMKDISSDNLLNTGYKIEKPEIIFQKIE